MPEMKHGEHLGPMIRRLREGAGLSQDELAERVEFLSGRGAGSLGRGDISRWEREARLTGPFWIGALASALDVPVSEMQAARGRSRAARAARTKKVAEPVSAQGILESLALDESMAPIVTTGGYRVGAGDAERILRRTHTLRLADDVIAGGDLVGPVTRELAGARELYRTSAHTADVGRALLVSVAELAQLAGWVGSDSGGAVDAARLYRLGVAAAREAGDGPLTGQLLGSLAYFESNRGASELGLQLAHAAVAATGVGAPPRARSLALDRLSWCATVAGDTQVALRAVAESQEVLAEYQPGEDDHLRWLYWVSEAERRVMEARVYTETRKPLRAVPLLREVLESYPVTHTRELALYLSWLAVALVEANEPEEAAAAARRMLEMTATVPSSRAGGRRTVVLAALRPYGDVPEVAEVLNCWPAA
ncbi:helix-turn-helix domain-containing protein [Streptomyces sp. JH002]|uniref:helix-turn-helix domain-containing protein n=1 Tax=Streptomyces sp. JH002 TaxID=2763259 RepID=UPI003D804773